MLGIVGHHLSVGTGMRAGEAAHIARELGVKVFEVSGIPCNVAGEFAQEIGADYGTRSDRNRPQIDVGDSDQEWKKVRESVEKEGIEIHAIGGYNDFALPEDKLNIEKERIIRFCKMAIILGSDVVRVFGGDLHKGMNREKSIKQIISCFREIIGVAERSGVYIAIENHLRLVNDADSLLEIIQSVGSPNLRVTLDFTNFYWLNADPKKTEDMIRQIAPYVVHTHFKNARFENGTCIFTSLGEGDMDIEMILDELLSAGYNRPFFIACESEDFSNIEALKAGFSKSIEYVTKLLNMRGIHC